MKEAASTYARVLATVTSFIGLVFLFSILSFLTQDSQTAEWVIFLSRPGTFLYGSFLWACFYIPLYLFAGAYLLIRRPFKRNFLYALTLSMVPFLSFSLFLKIVAERQPLLSPFPAVITEAFGRIPGAALMLVITAIEILLLVQLYSSLKKRIATAEPQETLTELRDRLFAEDEAQDPVPGASAQGAPVPGPNSPEANLPEANLSGADLPLANAPKANLPLGEGIFEDPLPSEEAADWADSADVEEQEQDSVLQEQDSVLQEQDSALEVEDAEFERVETELALVPQTDVPQTDVPQTRTKSKFGPYAVPIEGILRDYTDRNYWQLDGQTKASGEVLMKTLGEFNIEAELTGIQKGPVITMFEILPSPGVKLSRIVNLADNIALRLAALRVRIVAPIPGKHAVGIEVPNRERVVVPFKEMITLEKFQKSKYEIPVVLGKDISGGAQIVDLVQTPHLLIAGATGSGKSVCVNSIISSILYKKSPEQVKLLLIDPKIVELKIYNDIPHLLTPVITDPRRSYQALQYCIHEMERRYSLLDILEVRDIRSYNRKVKKNRVATQLLPYLVIVIDEFADLMATTGKEMEATLARLAAMSRAVGIHLVLATQRPSVDVITGLIKANIPSRIAFMVASKFDSRIILDTVGADKLLSQGDMLFVSAWDPVPVRIQGAFLAEEEIEAITAHVRTLGEPEYIDEEIFFEEEDGDLAGDGEEDPLMDSALDIIIAAGKASASYLQRRLKIGYNRAARLIEHMEMRGIIGPSNGSKPREIIHIPDRL